MWTGVDWYYWYGGMVVIGTIGGKGNIGIIGNGIRYF